MHVVVEGHVPPDADFDENGDVDGNDLTRWRNNFGTGTTHMQGDADADGDTDGADFLAWQRQLNAPTSAAVASAAVPEPAGDRLSWVGAIAAVVGIRRRRALTAFGRHVRPTPG